MVNPRERRKFARLDIALTVSYAVVGEGGKVSEYAEAVSSDISAGGLRLMTPTALNHGTKLDLEIFLGEEMSDKIHATGEVVWQTAISDSSYETGVVLQFLENADKTKFLSFVFDQMSRFVGLNVEK